MKMIRNRFDGILIVVVLVPIQGHLNKVIGRCGGAKVVQLAGFLEKFLGIRSLSTC